MSALLCIWPMLHIFIYFTIIPSLSLSPGNYGSSNALTFCESCSVANLIMSFESFGLYEISGSLGQDSGVRTWESIVLTSDYQKV